MYVLGIDSGLGGAVAVLPDLQIMDTPVADLDSGGRQYLPALMADLLVPWAGNKTMAFLEYQQAFPKQGVHSVFSIGMGYGIWLGVLGALKIPVTIVRPADWKREMLPGLGGVPKKKKKEAARLRALELYPGMSHMLHLIKHHDRAEALLLARYGLGVVK
jgi:crossover junction endodeoxyribonuclease RuvC